MSLKPILFHTDMVRAVQNGTKTVTRRVVRFPPGLTGHKSVGEAGNPDNPLGLMWACGIKRPPYLPGDILYVRETWTKTECLDGIAYSYKADGLPFPRWRPSTTMPREAARIFLRVKDVRVQQLKDVTEEDARAEGFYTRAGLVMAILKMYPDCTEESWLWVIAFERISREEATQNES